MNPTNPYETLSPVDSHWHPVGGATIYDGDATTVRVTRKYVERTNDMYSPPRGPVPWSVSEKPSEMGVAAGRAVHGAWCPRFAGARA